MQKTCTELTERLLKSLDKEYNVVDMGAVVDVITALEETSITKEVLEITRLGKYINELRRKTTNDALAKRAKDLVRKWRERHLSSSHNTHVTPVEAMQSQHPTSVNGTKPQSPLARVVKPPPSPAGRGIKPQSPLLRDPVKGLSPALSVNSEQNSRSPGLVPLKQATALAAATYRLNSTASPKLTNSNQNYSVEAVPRTHSSNKRLRKDAVTTPQPLSPLLNDIVRGDELPISKKQRLNGENVVSINSQVPSLSPTSRDQNSLDLSVASSTNPELEVGPKKRGRKKGSKSIKNQQIPEDRVKEKLASISRNPKLKTTQELLADLQARGSNVGGGTTTVGQSTRRTEPPTTEEILRSSEVNNQTKSTPRRDVDVVEPEVTSPKISTVEEILAQLPPLDVDSIRWSDDDEQTNGDEENRVDVQEITKTDVDRLHNECIEGLNGNFQMKILRTSDENAPEDAKEIMGVYKRRVEDGTDQEFREWHEMLARPSCDGQILHILPYVIID